MTDDYDFNPNALTQGQRELMTKRLLLRPQDSTRGKRRVSESVAIYNLKRAGLFSAYQTPMRCPERVW